MIRIDDTGLNERHGGITATDAEGADLAKFPKEK